MLAHQSVPGQILLLLLNIISKLVYLVLIQCNTIDILIIMSREHSQCTTLTSLRQSSFRRVSSQVNSHPRHPRHQQHYHCPHHCHNHHCYCYDNSHPSPRQILSLILDSFMVTMIATLIIIDDDESWSRCQVKFGSSSPWEGKFCLDQKWEKLIIVNAEDNDNDHCWKSPIFRNVYYEILKRIKIRFLREHRCYIPPSQHSWQTCPQMPR